MIFAKSVFCKLLKLPKIHKHVMCRFSSAQSVTVSRYVEVNGHKIHCEVVGKGDHHVLLLPGALGCTRTDFQPQLKGMNHDKFHIIGWDPPGYGLSTPKPRQWALNYLESDAHVAASLIRSLDIGRVSLLGWSDGGITALIIAGLYPHLVNKLVVWGANAYVTQKDVDLYEGIRDVKSWSERMRQPFVDVYGMEYFQTLNTGWVDAIELFFKQTGGDICKDKLPLIECPTLIIHGEKDALVPREHPELLLKDIKNSRLISMPEGKHNLHMRYADEFNKMAQDFLLEQ